MKYVANCVEEVGGLRLVGRSSRRVNSLNLLLMFSL